MHVMISENYLNMAKRGLLGMMTGSTIQTGIIWITFCVMLDLCFYSPLVRFFFIFFLVLILTNLNFQQRIFVTFASINNISYSSSGVS